MEKFDLLLELQKNYDSIKENSKELKIGSSIYSLKKLKDDFETTKVKYKGKEKEISQLREQYKVINEKLNNSKKEKEKDEYLLYNGAGSDLKLIEGLQKKVSDLKHNITELDNKTLEMLEHEEKLSLIRDNLRMELSDLKNEFESVKEIGNKRINSAKVELEKAHSKVKELEQILPQEILMKFKEIKELRGSAVAKIENGVCQGCKMRISSVTLDKIKKGYNIVYCDNCGRILFYNESETQV